MIKNDIYLSIYKYYDESSINKIVNNTKVAIHMLHGWC